MNKKIKILQLDGGGLLGTMFLVFLCGLEKATGKKIHDMFDVFIGTSTGAISGAMFAMGYTANEVLVFYKKHAKKIFKKKWFWMARGSKFDRKYIDSVIDSLMNKKMGSLTKQFICTGIDINQKFQPPHFFKNYKNKYKNFNISDLVKRSYSAPTFFEPYKYENQLWVDGGTGVQNCTLVEAHVETIRQNIKDYYILSCGCGLVPKRTNKNGLLSQVKVGISLARTNAVNEQIRYGKQYNFNFDRVDVEIDEKYDAMDNPKFMNQFILYGERMKVLHLNRIVEKLK